MGMMMMMKANNSISHLNFWMLIFRTPISGEDISSVLSLQSLNAVLSFLYV